MSPAMTSPATLSFSMTGVSVRYDDRTVLGPIDFAVARDQHWVVLGPNGSGKTTLVRVAALVQYPTTGLVTVLGEQWGQTDVRALRRFVGMSGAAMADQLRPGITAREVVMSGRHGALETWWHEYSEDDEAAALGHLADFEVDHLADHTFGTLSSGERQRVLLARTYVNEPRFVVLDEPTAGLDLGGREDLVQRLARLAADPERPPMMLVTHHLEEIPFGFTHVLMLREGQIVAQGPITDVLTSALVSECFGLPVDVTAHDGRWSAHARS
jgi:iron complex transport system ATP-binding protein